MKSTAARPQNDNEAAAEAPATTSNKHHTHTA